MPRYRVEEMGHGYYPKQTICWDCANALGGCSWSAGQFEPVDGWNAEYNEKLGTWRIIDCPLFHRDALNYGAKRIEKEEPAESLFSEDERNLIEKLKDENPNVRKQAAFALSDLYRRV